MESDPWLLLDDDFSVSEPDAVELAELCESDVSEMTTDVWLVDVDSVSDTDVLVVDDLLDTSAILKFLYTYKLFNKIINNLKGQMTS